MEMNSSEIIYLAGPYSNGSQATRNARFHAVTHVAARLIEQHRIVYSPLTMTHPIDLVLASEGETLGSEFWVAFDEAFMKMCTSISVLMLPGWEKSNGVRREIEYFEARGITPDYLAPKDFGIRACNPLFAAAFTER